VEPRKTFTKNLRAAIKREYRSVERFAYENGYSKSWLGKVLAGEVEPGFYKVVRLAKTLELSLDDLYPMKRKKAPK
jgi:transcriptional regulator with XRE-family HTH domain